MMARFLPYICFILLILLLCMEAQAGRLGPTPDDEVEALREVATQLGKKDWNFRVDPCVNESSWATPMSDLRPLYNNSLICNCSYPAGVCHVAQLFLKGQDLDGVLPPSLVKLPYLKAIDLARNYLNGTIPREWGSTKLEYLSIYVNKLSGPIPSYLGNITTLISLNLENNLFSGIVPPELGNLVDLEILILSANNLTGELPIALTNISKLMELRISSNNFAGKIPDFFQSWTQLHKLELQASGLEGPIPSSISILSNLIELRISDLLGHWSEFPNLSKMTSMRRLMLRSCKLYGPIPATISEMANLQILDLSFNKLEGSTPDFKDQYNMDPSFDRLEENVPDFVGQSYLKYMFLTSNKLNGLIPNWIKARDNSDQIDLSYNDFNYEWAAPPSCNQTNLNLFDSFFVQDNLTHGGDCVCMKTYPCSKDLYSLHINCGGSATVIGNIEYEGDQNQAGPAMFFPNTASWGFSSSGMFWDVNKTSQYIANNVSILRMNNSELFTSARLSPLSLTYYARCLANGNYTVKLYFAEIVFRDDRTFYSLGRRIFDIYIQENSAWKDFDIEHEAQGVDKSVVKEFKAVVRNKVLQIRFHWAGKGTAAVPMRGTYGPLISAISVKSDFSPPNDDMKTFIVPPNDDKKIFIVVGAVVSARSFL